MWNLEIWNANKQGNSVYVCVYIYEYIYMYKIRIFCCFLGGSCSSLICCLFHVESGWTPTLDPDHRCSSLHGLFFLITLNWKCGDKWSQGVWRIRGRRTDCRWVVQTADMKQNWNITGTSYWYFIQYGPKTWGFYRRRVRGTTVRRQPFTGQRKNSKPEPFSKFAS